MPSSIHPTPSSDAVLTDLVTVVIPVWGAYAASLDSAIASAQHSNSTVLVVDNASETPVVCDAQVLCLSKRVSLGEARNSALPHVLTPYVLFLDADDQLIDGALDELLTLAGHHKVNEVTVAARLRDPRSASEYHWPRPWQRRASVIPKLFAVLESIRPAFPVQGSLLPRKLVVGAGGYATEPESAEDWVLGVSLAWRSTVVFASGPTVNYSPTPHGLWESASSLRVHMRHRRFVRKRLRAELPLLCSCVLTLPLALAQVTDALRQHFLDRGES